MRAVAGKKDTSANAGWSGLSGTGLPFFCRLRSLGLLNPCQHAFRTCVCLKRTAQWAQNVAKPEFLNDVNKIGSEANFGEQPHGARDSCREAAACRSEILLLLLVEADHTFASCRVFTAIHRTAARRRSCGKAGRQRMNRSLLRVSHVPIRSTDCWLDTVGEFARAPPDLNSRRADRH